MNHFQVLPIEIIGILQLYLNNDDYRQFLNTSQAIFQKLKYDTVSYNVRINGRRVKTIEDLHRITKHLTNSVKEKAQQIAVKISRPTEMIMEYCAGFLVGIRKLIFENNNQGVYDFWGNSPNMSLFCNIYHVCLQYIEGIDRLSGLIGVKILEVKDSSSLTAIDFIPGLKRLVLDKLNNLLDISQYGNIPELQVIGCLRLSLQGLGNHEKVCITWSDDISMLRNVKYLDIAFDYQSEPSKSVPVFDNLIYLVVRSYDGLFDGRYFPNLQFLKLCFVEIASHITFPSKVKLAQFEHCHFDDLIGLQNIKELMFHNCRGRGFSEVNALSNAHQLDFCYIDELENVSSLGEVYALRIAFCSKVKNVSNLGRVKLLRIEHCAVTSLEGLGQRNNQIRLSELQATIDFSPLRSIYKVTLEWCDGLVDGKQLANVQHLTLHRCKNFEDTSDLGKVKSLCLVECSKLKRLVGLEDVPQIHLQSCYGLEDIDCLGKQRSLIIFKCDKLNSLIDADKSKKYERLFEKIPFVKISVKEYSWYAPSRISRSMPDMFEG